MEQLQTLSPCKTQASLPVNTMVKGGITVDFYFYLAIGASQPYYQKLHMKGEIL